VKKISGSQLSALVALQITGSSIALGSGDDAMQDSWIAALFAVVIAVPVMWMYASILRLSPGRSYFGIAEETFGKVGGKIFTGLYICYAVFLGAQVFRVLDEFIQLVNLPRTPQVIILAFSVPLVAVQIRCGPKNVASCAKFLLPIILIFLGIMFILGLPFMDPQNIRPVFGAGTKAIMTGAFYNFSLSMGETVLCLPFFEETEPSVKPFRILLNGVILGGINLAIITFRNLLLLGAPVCQMYLFASYDAVGVISVGEFITRISVLIGINMVLTATSKISVALYSATVGVSRILGLHDTLRPAASCATLMAALSYILYSTLLSGMSMRRYLPFTNMPFQLLLPLLLLICGKIKKKNAKKHAKAPAPLKTAAAPAKN